MSKPKFRPRTKAQNSIIHSLLGRFGFKSEDKAELVYDITGGRTEHSSEMSFAEAEQMINRLGGNPRRKKESDAAPRTVQARRREAGVETIATATHKDLMNRLARGREMSEQGLGDLSARVNKGTRSPRTSKEVNRVIEAIKNMNRRDKTFNLKQDDQEAA